MSEFEGKFQFLKATQPFEQIPDNLLSKIAERLQVNHYPSGAVIIRAGAPGDILYILHTGLCESVFTNEEGAESVIKPLPPGSCIGIMSILTGEAHSVTVRVREDVEFFVLNKADLDALISENPGISTYLNRILTQKIREAYSIAGQEKTRSEEEHRALEEKEQRLLAMAGAQLNREEKFIGEPAYVRKIESFVESMAERSDPVLILGEGGTGRSMMARMIHWKGKREAGPFIEVDCATLKENFWGGEIFGYEKGAFAEATTRRLGFLELAEGGTLMLTNVEMLGHATQATLQRFLKEGWFHRVGSQEHLTSTARIIATSSDDLRELVERGEMKLNLYQALSDHTFTIQPLRKRRRDIPLIAEHCLRIVAKELHKDVRKIDRPAMEALSSYDWPGNTLELENVLRRAAIVTRSDTITAEQIFFGLPTVGGKAFFNLLSIDRLRNFVQGMLYPGLFQFLAIGGFMLFLLELLLGPDDGTENMAAIMIWTIGWFGIYGMTLLAGRIWCGFCPFSTIGRWIQKAGICLNKPTPEWIRKHSGTIMSIFVLALFWSEGMTLMYTDPVLTAELFLLITAGAVLFSVIYERRVWCRYICPFGNLMGIHALASVVALRANKKICTSQCQSHACYVGGDRAEGCPLFLHPYGIESNRYCTLCANCIKNCPHRSIRLNVQIPAEGILTLENYTMSGSFLSIALMAVLIVENGSLLGRDSLAFALLAERAPIPYDLLYTIVFLAVITLPFFGLWLYEWVITGFDRTKTSVRLNMLGFSFIPLALAGHLAFYLDKALHGTDRLVVMAGELIGRSWSVRTVEWWGYENLREFQHWLIIAGAAGVVYVLRDFIRKHTDIFDRKRRVLWGYGTMLGVAMYLYWQAMTQ